MIHGRMKNNKSSAGLEARIDCSGEGQQEAKSIGLGLSLLVFYWTNRQQDDLLSGYVRFDLDVTPYGSYKNRRFGGRK
jgi:hypothetical protein